MRYNLSFNYETEPQPFNRTSGKELLQYAVGGLLYMPASNTRIANKIISGEYSFVKSMVLDLEDSLGDDLVDYGVRTIAQTVSTLADAVEKGKLLDEDIPLIFIRVRGFGQMTGVAKSLGSLIKYITGFNIPKFDSLNCDRYIEEFSSLPPHLYIMPIIENKQALYQQLRMPNLLAVYDCLNKLSGQVLNIRVGGADFCNVLGVRRGIADTIYDIGTVRSALEDIINVFGRSYVVSGPVWEYFHDKNSPTDKAWRVGLQAEIKKDRLNGFIGKTCIHPSQLPVVQQSLVVDSADYQEAVSILGMNENMTGVSKGVLGNRMNEVKTHTNWARKIVGLASVYGTLKGKDGVLG